MAAKLAEEPMSNIRRAAVIGSGTMGASIAVVPLTIPLLTGPASMSTVVIYADRAQNF